MEEPWIDEEHLADMFVTALEEDAVVAQKILDAGEGSES